MTAHSRTSLSTINAMIEREGGRAATSVVEAVIGHSAT
jgi:hypothetical protein